MSGLQLIIPLDSLPQGTEMTTEGIMSSISDAQKAREDAEFYKKSYNSLVTDVQGAGRSLKLILDEVDDEFHRVQALRNFAEQMVTMGKSVREMP